MSDARKGRGAIQDAAYTQRGPRYRARHKRRSVFAGEAYQQTLLSTLGRDDVQRGSSRSERLCATCVRANGQPQTARRALRGDTGGEAVLNRRDERRKHLFDWFECHTPGTQKRCDVVHGVRMTMARLSGDFY